MGVHQITRLSKLSAPSFLNKKHSKDVARVLQVVQLCTTPSLWSNYLSDDQRNVITACKIIEERTQMWTLNLETCAKLWVNDGKKKPKHTSTVVALGKRLLKIERVGNIFGPDEDWDGVSLIEWYD